jgi:hypothetical protein
MFTIAIKFLNIDPEKHSDYCSYHLPEHSNISHFSGHTVLITLYDAHNKRNVLPYTKLAVYTLSRGMQYIYVEKELKCSTLFI